jgi:hypothetical protein
MHVPAFGNVTEQSDASGSSVCARTIAPSHVPLVQSSFATHGAPLA